MDELLLVAHGIMKLALVVCLMVLIATAPAAKSVTAAGRRRSVLDVERSQTFDDSGFHSGFTGDDEDEFEITCGQHGIRPMVNVDGTPMCGDFDIHGNPHGVAGGSFIESNTFGSDSTNSEHLSLTWQTDCLSDRTSNYDWGATAAFGGSTSSPSD